MPYEEKSRPVSKPHNVIMEDRARLSVSGIEDVENYDDNQISVLTVKGRLIIRGSNLHISRLSIDTGELNVDGTMTDLIYEDAAPGGSLWSRLFK